MDQSEIDFFDRLAPDWDANEVNSTPERIKSILSKLPLRKGQNILDLGTGTGVLIPYLSEIVGEEGEVVGIDLSKGMLSRAKDKYGDLPNVRFLKLDFEEEELPGMYDVVMLFCVYPHLHSPQDTLQWLFKMNIKPGGCAVIAFSSDEKFINEIHHKRGSDSDHLLPAHLLAREIAKWDYRTEVLASTPDEYIILIDRNV
ncbi:MAG: class I SAM-dependent methyltransferase, partial [Muribaculaceae bacterium]|nr:class I SAM-dependent methyltransferase [Muribaculaceae bacterium]